MSINQDISVEFLVKTVYNRYIISGNRGVVMIDAVLYTGIVLMFLGGIASMFMICFGSPGSFGGRGEMFVYAGLACFVAGGLLISGTVVFAYIIEPFVLPYI